MKLNDIKKETTRIVAEHLADGWMLDFDDTSRGCQTCHVLIKDKEVRSVYATWETYDYDGEERINDAFRVGVCATTVDNIRHCGRWNDEDSILYEKNYYRIGDNWYTDDKELAKEATKKKAQRYWRCSDSTQNNAIRVTAQFVESIRQIAGFEKATKKNLRVKKMNYHHRSGYEVTMLNRVGNPKAVRFYSLA